MIGTFLIPYIVPKWVEHRVTIITSLGLLALATALTGPFFEEENLIAMCVGLGLSGFLMSFLSIPNMPEMMKGTREAYPNCDLDHANSLLSGMLNAGFGIGQAIGPILGSLLYEWVGFRSTMDITAIACLSYALIYFLCAGGCHAYVQTCRNFSKRHESLKRSVVDEAID